MLAITPPINVFATAITGKTFASHPLAYVRFAANMVHQQYGVRPLLVVMGSDAFSHFHSYLMANLYHSYPEQAKKDRESCNLGLPATFQFDGMTVVDCRDSTNLGLVNFYGWQQGSGDGLLDLVGRITGVEL